MKTLITILFLLASTSILIAQKTTTPPEPRKTAEQRADMTVEKMTAELGLTAEQQTQIRDIVLKKEKMRDAGLLTEDDKKKFKKDVQAVLTKEQQQKYHELKKEQKNHKDKEGKKSKADSKSPKEQPVTD